MAYRDDNEALRARVAELEQRLALSEALVERLLGRDARSSHSSKPDMLVGAVVHRVDTTSFDVALDEEGLEAAANVVRARLGHAVTRTGSSLEGARTRGSWLGERRGGAFGLATDANGTSLRLETDLRRLPIVVAIGPVLGALASLPLVLWQMDRFHHFEEALSPSTSLPIVALLMLLGTLASRLWAGRLARREDELHRGVWAALLEISRAHARLRAVRVEAPAGSGHELEEPDEELRPARAAHAGASR